MDLSTPSLLFYFFLVPLFSTVPYIACTSTAHFCITITIKDVPSTPTMADAAMPPHLCLMFPIHLCIHSRSTRKHYETIFVLPDSIVKRVYKAPERTRIGQRLDGIRTNITLPLFVFSFALRILGLPSLVSIPLSASLHFDLLYQAIVPTYDRFCTLFLSSLSTGPDLFIFVLIILLLCISLILHNQGDFFRLLRLLS